MCWCYEKITVVSRRVWGHAPPPPEKFLNLRLLDCIFNKKFNLVLLLRIFFFFSWGGGVVLGGTCQDSPLLNRTLYTVM